MGDSLTLLHNNLADTAIEVSHKHSLPLIKQPLYKWYRSINTLLK